MDMLQRTSSLVAPLPICTEHCTANTPWSRESRYFKIWNWASTSSWRHASLSPCNYSCCQKGSRSGLFFLLLEAFRRLNVAEEKQTNPKLWKSHFFWVTYLCLHNIAVSISRLVYLSVSLRGTLGLKLISALVMGNISHDHERHSNVAVFRSLTETVESKDRLLNIYS